MQQFQKSICQEQTEGWFAAVAVPIRLLVERLIRHGGCSRSESANKGVHFVGELFEDHRIGFGSVA
jgi:hypothetical protein